MKLWKDSQREVRSVRPDKEKAKSIRKMINVRLGALEIELKNKEEFSSLIVEDYYEIIKEAITATMSADGFKTLSHEVLIAYLKEFFPQFSDSEIALADRLRQLRNKIAYNGFFITTNFLERNKKEIRGLVEKLQNILDDRLK